MVLNYILHTNEFLVFAFYCTNLGDILKQRTALNPNKLLLETPGPKHGNLEKRE